MRRPPAIIAAWLCVASVAHPADESIPDEITFERAIEYARLDGTALELNMARPKRGDGPFPAVVCIHGGGFVGGTREGYDKRCVALAQRDLEHERARHIRASPLNWVTPAAAPTLCIHGTDDKYVAHEQAVWLVDRLKACGVEAELLTMEGAGHGFKGDDAAKADQKMFAFFAAHLQPAGH